MNAIKIIPGTVLDISKTGGVMGEDFLNSVFYISDGIMLSYIREITGIGGTTLQNWVQRGWVLNPKNKLYSKEQLARILIINMVRDTMQLSKISYLLEYINGDVENTCDDIISESKLYDYICRAIAESNLGKGDLDDIIANVTADYNECFPGAASRLKKAIKIIMLSYKATAYKNLADAELKEIED